MSEKSIGFIYSFWDKENNLLYVGKTTQELLTRLRAHHHCKNEMYKKVKYIKFFNCSNPLILTNIEIYLINKLKPIYNALDVYENTEEFLEYEKFFNLQNFSYTWIELPEEIFNFSNYTSRSVGSDNKILKLSPDEIKERQKIGIEKAKAKGKYTGRQPINIDFELWETLYKKWKNKEITATECFKTLKISSNTFYRKVQIYEKTGKLN